MAISEQDRFLIDRFISAFNKIDEHLCEVTGLEREVVFSSRAKEFCRLKPWNTIYQNLRTFSDLRNILEHNQKGAIEFPCVPTEDFVASIEFFRFGIPVSRVVHPERFAPLNDIQD